VEVGELGCAESTLAAVEQLGLANGRHGIGISRGIFNVIVSNTIMNHSGNGVDIRGGALNVVGGDTTAAANFIGFNLGDGVHVSECLISSVLGTETGTTTGTSRMTISGNQIVSNRGDGVEVFGTRVTTVTIGENVTGARITGLANTIHGNGGKGVVVNGARRVSINGNSIADNTDGAIDLRNTGNPNTVQLLGDWTLNVFRRSNSQIVFSGTIQAPAGQQYERFMIDVYRNDAWDENPQMRHFLGRRLVTTDANGRATFEFTINGQFDVEDVFTATATSLVFGAGSTSEHSIPSAVQLLPMPGTGGSGGSVSSTTTSGGSGGRAPVAPSRG